MNKSLQHIPEEYRTWLGVGVACWWRCVKVAPFAAHTYPAANVCEIVLLQKEVRTVQDGCKAHLSARQCVFRLRTLLSSVFCSSQQVAVPIPALAPEKMQIQALNG